MVENEEPKKIDFYQERIQRQHGNTKMVFDSIKKGTNIKSIRNLINYKELGRCVVDDIRLSGNNKITAETLIERASKDDSYNSLLSGRISKIATKQGKIDEKTQIKVCSETCLKYGIYMERYEDDSPKKTGGIVSKKYRKDNGIYKDECLKSFDGKISGKIVGRIIAKVCFGLTGGHQANVESEIDGYCEWVKNFERDNGNMYIFLIETDKLDWIERIKEKYISIKEIIISDHYTFQKYVIKNFKRT